MLRVRDFRERVHLVLKDYGNFSVSQKGKRKDLMEVITVKGTVGVYLEIIETFIKRIKVRNRD